MRCERGKNSFAKVSENLAGYTDLCESKFVRPSK